MDGRLRTFCMCLLVWDVHVDGVSMHVDGVDACIDVMHRHMHVQFARVMWSPHPPSSTAHLHRLQPPHAHASHGNRHMARYGHGYAAERSCRCGCGCGCGCTWMRKWQDICGTCHVMSCHIVATSAPPSLSTSQAHPSLLISLLPYHLQYLVLQKISIPAITYPLLRLFLNAGE